MAESKRFSVKELLINIFIIALLAAILIPQDAGHLIEGHDASARRALREAATAEERYFIDHDVYISCRY